ncbi:MAG TPA: hypothetical protein DCQ98_21855 [Planctomycetaceae bacterium]|nr:hypothetical protein [Planctomycetaceae bacterium]HRF02612.1 type I restriction enzyme HsdR N-terminal domain-containing protein [Pirellulaceae bacterium]
MDMIDKLRELAARVERVRSRCVTEEGTKNALVMPFIQALGYDVFDPLQVVPEFTADVGIKKGEKVDYALLRDDKPIILFECKALGAKLDESKSSQLHRYFHTTSARFAILTDGVHYKLFTDLESPNLMDARPFLEFDLTRIDDRTANEIKKFSRELFDVDQILSSASTLKYVKGIRQSQGLLLLGLRERSAAKELDDDNNYPKDVDPQVIRPERPQQHIQWRTAL